MIDSERTDADLAYLRSRVDWIQLSPFGIEDLLAPLQVQLLMQASRDFHFQRYRGMAHAARAVQHAFGPIDDHGIALSDIGLATAHLGEVAEAFDALTQARDGWPGVPAHHHNCGVLALRFSDELDIAEGCFRAAVVRDVEHGLSWLALAVIRLQRGHDEGCVDAARKAIALGASPGGVAELCLAAALERLGRVIEWPELSPDARFAAPVFDFPARTAQRTVLSVALGDREAQAALRLARSLESVASSWNVHLHLCNVSPAVAGDVQAWAETRPERADVTVETIVADPPPGLADRFSAIRLRTLAAFGQAGAGDLVLAHPRTVFSADPVVLLPNVDAGVSLAVQDGLLWNRVGQDLIGLRSGEAASAFMADIRGAAMPSLWRKAPMAAGVSLWRAWTARPGAKVLTQAERAVATIAEEAPAPAPCRRPGKTSTRSFPPVSARCC
jgi:hypothetical protein